MSVLLATWGRPANTTADEIRIFDGRGRLLGELSLPPGSVKDNTYVPVELARATHVVAGDILYVALSSPNSSAGEAITAWRTVDESIGRLYRVGASRLASNVLDVGRLAATAPQAGAMCLRLSGIGKRGMAVEEVVRWIGVLIGIVAAVGVWYAEWLKGWYLAAESRLQARDRESGGCHRLDVSCRRAPLGIGDGRGDASVPGAR